MSIRLGRHTPLCTLKPYLNHHGDEKDGNIRLKKRLADSDAFDSAPVRPVSTFDRVLGFAASMIDPYLSTTMAVEHAMRSERIRRENEERQLEQSIDDVYNR